MLSSNRLPLKSVPHEHGIWLPIDNEIKQSFTGKLAIAFEEYQRKILYYQHGEQTPCERPGPGRVLQAGGQHFCICLPHKMNGG